MQKALQELEEEGLLLTERTNGKFVTTDLDLIFACKKREAEKIAKEVGIEYLPANFKKNNGYLKSIENSKKYGLYRQNYCGCIYSKRIKEN